MASGGIELNSAQSSYPQKRQLDVELSVRILCPKHLVVRLQSIVFHTFIFNNGAGFFLDTHLTVYQYYLEVKLGVRKSYLRLINVYSAC